MALVGETACCGDAGRWLPTREQAASRQQALLHEVGVRGGAVGGPEGAGELEPIRRASRTGKRVGADSVRERVVQPFAGAPRHDPIVRAARSISDTPRGTFKVRTQQTHDRIEGGVNQQAVHRANACQGNTRHLIIRQARSRQAIRHAAIRRTPQDGASAPDRVSEQWIIHKGFRKPRIACLRIRESGFHPGTR